ncbi:MAG TPA: ABC transporter substrate-binding protein [Solirubrobacteraceae bacterium]|nr:ABC transporter substrate-binding protein [Solirubrobacteraceae bacterium]
MPRHQLHPRAARTGAVLTLAGAAALSLGACGSQNATANTMPTLTVGFVVDPSWAQIPVAAQAGLFKAAGVNVKVVNFSTGPQALQALEAGQVDVTTSADVPVAAVLAHAATMKIIADGSRWKGSVVVANRAAGISSAATLRGKSIGTPLGTSAAYFAATFLSTAGTSAKLVNVDPSAMVTAMQQDNVPAVSVFQPYQQQVISALGKQALVLKPGPGAYVQQSLILASTQAIHTKAAALKDFETALARASTSLAKETPSAVTAVSSATQLSPALVKAILPQFDYRVELPQSLSGQLTALGSWAKKVGNLSGGVKLPDYAGAIDRSFLPAA